MLFLNQDVIKNDSYLKIGFVSKDTQEISCNKYMLCVEDRLLTLVVKSMKDNMAGGYSKEKAIESLCTYIYAMLTFEEKSYPTDCEGIVKEIMESVEFSNWSSDIWHRFRHLHLGKVDKDTPIPMGDVNKNVSDEIIKLIEQDDSLEYVISGLSATNTPEL